MDKLEKISSRGIRYFENADGDVLEKECSRCKDVKSLDLFAKQKQGFAGRRSYCKSCASDENREYLKDPENSRKTAERKKRWRKDNPEKYKQSNHEWYLKNKDKPSYKARMAEWRTLNKDRLFELNRKGRIKNKERLAHLKREWLKNNRNAVSAKAHRRRARKKFLPDALTSTQARELLELQEGRCLLTGESEGLHLEHFIPLSFGHGGTTFENCYWMSGALNKSKSELNPFKWIQRQDIDVQDNFNEVLVPILAERNNMSIEGFTDYVNWCAENTRSIDELADNYMLSNPKLVVEMFGELSEGGGLGGDEMGDE